MDFTLFTFASHTARLRSLVHASSTLHSSLVHPRHQFAATSSSPPGPSPHSNTSFAQLLIHAREHRTAKAIIGTACNRARRQRTAKTTILTRQRSTSAPPAEAAAQFSVQFLLNRRNRTSKYQTSQGHIRHEGLDADGFYRGVSHRVELGQCCQQRDCCVAVRPP